MCLLVVESPALYTKIKAGSLMKFIMSLLDIIIRYYYIIYIIIIIITMMIIIIIR